MTPVRESLGHVRTPRKLAQNWKLNINSFMSPRTKILNYVLLGKLL